MRWTKLKCEICESDNITVIYDDYIRDGAPGILTNKKYKMYQCCSCNTIWHASNSEENEEYYIGTKYRDKLEGTVEIEDYYKLHDFEVLDKLNYCGTTIFRNSSIADIGCGGGSFLDFVSGVADNVIAIEPSAEYRKSLAERGYHTYAYAKESKKDWADKLNVVTSFDVIEHVDNPIEFMKDVYDILAVGGKGIIGTPTDCPVMRTLLGKTYEQGLLYSYQHNWILSKKGFEICCEKAGFKNVRIKPIQRYGISNLIAWANNKKPFGHIRYEFITDSLDSVYKCELEKIGMSDYIIAYVEK